MAQQTQGLLGTQHSEDLQSGAKGKYFVGTPRVEALINNFIKNEELLNGIVQVHERLNFSLSTISIHHTTFSLEAQLFIVKSGGAVTIRCDHEL